MADLRAWVAARDASAGAEYPPLVWVASPEVIRGARLSADATALERRRILAARLARAEDRAQPLVLRSRRRPRSSRAGRIKVRGETRDGDFHAAHALARGFPDRSCSASGAAFAHGRRGGTALRALMRAEPQGGAPQPVRDVDAMATRFGARGRAAGRAVLAIMVNGAQGDDDEAHAGHFALVTGRTREDGAIGDWLVNNFYALDSESEKGILAAPVPLDNYLADLNSGQGWYRPSQMLVLVLASDRAAALVQGALNRIYNQFWRHQLPYRHATMNCTGISVDVLRALGWPIPARGPTSRTRGGSGLSLLRRQENDRSRRPASHSTIWSRTRRGSCRSPRSRNAVRPRWRWSRPEAPTLPLPGHSRGCWRRTSTPSPSSGFRSSRRAARSAMRPSQRRGNSRRGCLRIAGSRRSFRFPPVRFPDALRDPDLVRAPRPASDYAVAAWGVLVALGGMGILLSIFKQYLS